MKRLLFALAILPGMLVLGLAPAPALAVPPTVASAIPDTTVAEDSSPVDNYRDLNNVFTDAEDGSALTFTIESNSNPGLVNVVIDPDSILDLSFTPNGDGPAEIVIRATDSELLFVEDTLVVTVTATNDNPTMTSTIPDTTVTEDSSPVDNYRDLNNVFSDIEDGSALDFTIESNSNPGLLNAVIDPDSALDLSFVPNQSGSATLRVRATDSGGLFIEDTLAVVVTPVNDNPTIVSAIPDTVVLVNTAPIDDHVDLNDVFWDIESGGSLTFTVQGNSDPATVNVAIDSDSTIDLSFNPDAHGEATIVIRATDPNGGFTDDSFVVTVHRTLWIIKADGSGHEPTIQAALDVAFDGDTLMLTDGTYTGDGNRELDINGTAILITSENGPETTILDVQGTGRCFNPINNGEGPNTIISNITIKGGSHNNGGGMQIDGTSPTIIGNIFIDCTGTNGAAINCAGGGTALIKGNIFINNDAGQGGGIYTNGASPTIDGNTFTENGGVFGGAAMHFRNANSSLVSNNIIVFSMAGPGMVCTGGANPTISCSNIFGNAGGDAICGTDGGGNISADPMFCGPIGSGNVYIDGFSPCAPANNSCGVLIGALSIGCTATPALVDAANTVYPSVAFVGDPNLVLHIGLDNSSPVGVMLNTASVILFSDSVNTFQAALANPTYVPGNAGNFTATFSAGTVPADMNAPASYDLKLYLEGVDDGAFAYTDTIVTTGRNSILVDAPKVIVSSLPLQVEDAFPGKRNTPILLLDFQNGYGGDRLLDSLLVTNMTFGPGTQAQLDGEIERLYAFDDVDSSRGLSGPDTLVAQSTFSSGRSSLIIGGQWGLPGLSRRSLVITADVDSTSVRDADQLDAAIVSPSHVVFQDDTETNKDFSPLYPLNSFGHLVVDGMAGHQVTLLAEAIDTLYAGTADVLLSSIVVPQNGYDADTLTALSIKDFAGDLSPGDLASLHVYLDDGNTLFDAAFDIDLGELVYSGDRFEITGLSEELAPEARLFLVADIDPNAVNGHHFKLGIPLDGIGVASFNDGPVDNAVISPKTFTFKNAEVVGFANLPFSGDLPRPGTADVRLLRLAFTNNTLNSVTLDSLRLSNSSRGAGSPAELDNTLSKVRIYDDDGNGVIDGSEPLLADDLHFSNGSLSVMGLGLDFEPGETKHLLITSDIDSFCAADGDTLEIRVDGPADIGIDPPFTFAGSFPAVTPAILVVDGMKAFQIVVHHSIDSLVVTGGTDVLILDVGIPANGYSTDTLGTFTVRNEGTATSEHFDRLALYLDGGDRTFDAGSADDVHLGDLIENPAEPGGKSFLISGLAAPLESPCGDHTRFYLATDIAPDYSVAGTIQMAIPVMGLEVTSGNDGPVDISVTEESILLIPKPDQLTVFPYPVGDQIVYARSTENLHFGVGLYNGYSYPLALEQIKLYQVGTISSTEVDSIFAYADADSNGLFDPAKDVRIAAIASSGASYVFDGFDLNLNPRKITYLFITYDLPLAVTDAATFDLRLFDPSDLVVEPFGTDIEGEFPINSPGADVVDGMIAAQISRGNAPPYNPSPNNFDILAMTLVVPPNGIWTDVLDYLTIENNGTAVGGTDITSMRVWKEAGGHPTKFDPNNDDPLDYLDWSGGTWRNSAPLNEPIPLAGLRVHVTFSVTSTPTDGATIQARLPINGIEVASENDGPIDQPVVNTTVQTISTDPLITSLLTDQRFYSAGQDITLSMTTRNEGADTLYGVRPSVISLNGSGDATPISGPIPGPVDLLPGIDTTFVWTYSALVAGDLSFCGFAYTADSLDVSEQTCSEIISIQNRAGGVPIALTNAAPPAANRGQENVKLFKLVFDYGAGDTLSAPIQVNGVALTVEDGTGNPLPPNEVLSRIRLTDSHGSNYTISVTDSLTSPLSIESEPPIEIPPGTSLTINVNCDISDSATLTSFRVGIQALNDIDVTDANDRAPAAMTSTNLFPWTTTTLVVNSAAESLLVTSSSGSAVLANTGQEDLHVFAIDVSNPGDPNTAREILTDLTLSFFDTLGTDISPNAVIKKIEIRAAQTTLFEDDPALASGNALAMNLSTPLVLPPGALQTVDIFVDLKDLPQTNGFYVALADAGSFVARDINTGELVVVTAMDPPVRDFPFVSDRVVFQAPASGIAASFVNRSPSVIPPSAAEIPIMDLVLNHQDTSLASSARIDSLSLQFMEPGGSPVHPGDFFSALFITHNGDTVSFETSLSSTSPIAECRLNMPVVLNPGESETLSVLVDSKTLFSPTALEVRVESQNLVVRDANDGSRIFGISGAFPFVAGPVSLQLPSNQVAAGLISRVPPNISAQEPNLPVFDLVITNGDSDGYTPVELVTLHVQARDEKGSSIDPTTIAGGARLITGDSTVVDGQVNSSEIVFSLTGGSVVVPSGHSDTVSVVVDVATGLSDRNFRLVVQDTTSIEMVDVVTQRSIAVGTVSDVGYPLSTDWTNVLGNNAQSAYTNYPNPFAAGREQTTVTYYLEQKSNVSLKLYTIWGAPVITLVDNRNQDPGLHQTIKWDGRNGDGDVVNNGVYYLVLEIRGNNGSNLTLKRKVGVIR